MVAQDEIDEPVADSVDPENTAAVQDTDAGFENIAAVQDIDGNLGCSAARNMNAARTVVQNTEVGVERTAAERGLAARTADDAVYMCLADLPSMMVPEALL